MTDIEPIEVTISPVLPSWKDRPLNLPALNFHAEMIRNTPEEEWTETERQFMADGVKWAVEAMAVLIKALEPVAEALVGAFVAIGRAIVQAAEQQASTRLPESSTWPDAYRHVEGLPGVSDRCWADVWIDSIGDYRVCNAEAVNKLGTCKEHKL